VHVALFVDDFAYVQFQKSVVDRRNRKDATRASVSNIVLLASVTRAASKSLFGELTSSKQQRTAAR
jgi:hypothetical protein